MSPAFGVGINIPTQFKSLQREKHDSPQFWSKSLTEGKNIWRKICNLVEHGEGPQLTADTKELKEQMSDIPPHYTSHYTPVSLIRV